MSNARFSILQARAVKDKRISDAQFRTLAALGMYADEDGWCFPKQITIGDDLGKSRQAVNRDIKSLKDLGYLEVNPRYREDGSQTSNLYRLKYDLPPMGGETPALQGVKHSYVTGGETSGHYTINDPDNEPINTNKKGDWIDGLIALQDPKTEQEIDEVENMLDRLEQELHVNIKRTGKNQGIAKRLVREEKQGRTLDQWLLWLKSSEWRLANLHIYRDMERIWGEWPQAFAVKQQSAQGWHEL